MSVTRLLQRKQGILLDISLGGQPQSGSVTMAEVWDAAPPGRRARGRQLVPPALRLPFPLPDACVHTAVVTHVLEYLDPGAFFPWFDELHRVMRPHGLVHMSGPYGGDDSVGWIADPAHRTRIVESTFSWLDESTPIYKDGHASVGRPRPRPWRLAGFTRVPNTPGTYGYNATILAVPLP